MELKLLKPRSAINKAFLKITPTRPEIELFKSNLIRMMDTINESELEEFHKNELSDFLKNTYYSGNQFINTKDRKDLVIHNGATASSTVGVIMEVKRPANKVEMLKADNLNTKAFQELVFYYLHERITNKNTEIKHLIATNIYEWFVFDAHLFEKLFAQNKALVSQFIDFVEKRAGGGKTDFFYTQIAAPAIEAIEQEVSFAYFDIRDYEKPLRNNNPKDDNLLIALYKMFSPQHLLKLPFANDSNSLDKAFYDELLHIIGLTETKDNGKKLIQRKALADRNAGSLLENVITQLESHDKLARIPNLNQYGNNNHEQLFGVALELVITWINRVLFLKLLEAQLVAFNHGNKDFRFLNNDKIRDFDDLDKLFFRVLAKKPLERDEKIQQLFGHVPYLNSSLFEPTELEHQTLFVSGLEDYVELPFLSSTVLKDALGKKVSTPLNTLQYLFEFLDAYNFSSDGSDEIQEDNKRLINASVLGLIFEKINGYKDGSFFTPGFITMYMSRETIRRAVLQKFNDAKGWNCKDFDELSDKITDSREANEIINSLKICDPAVGSGHFLVSALNEIIAIKSELNILLDRNGKRLKNYVAVVVNDNLEVYDKETDEGFFYLKPIAKREIKGRNMLGSDPLSVQSNNISERQLIQETLFHEKQTIIENCLFGVDINPNSVKICRLRLWIELLKNAYYRVSPVEAGHVPSLQCELETLPNIDINIKCGNSLISRFALDADIKKALKRSRWTIDSYRIAVMTYRNAQTKDEKRAMEKLIFEIKNDFESEIAQNDKRLVALSSLRGELYELSNQTKLFEQSKAEKAKFNKAVEEKTLQIEKLEKELEEFRTNKIYENAFEWRFEFPEVLNEEGDFVGFDVVIGNPPYIQLQAMKDISEQLKQFEYKTYEKMGDIYSLFYEKGNNLLRENGFLGYITSNKWMRAGYGKTTRKYILQHTQPILLVDIGSGVFDEATVDSNLLLFQKTNFTHPFDALDISKEKNVENISLFKDRVLPFFPKVDESWIISSDMEQIIKNKIEAKGIPLKDWDISIYRGVLTGYNDAFIIDAQKKDELIAADPRSAELIKPILRGRDIKRYKAEFADLWLIYIPKGFTIKGKNNENATINIVSEPMPRYGYYEIENAWTWFEKQLPAIAKHLKPFEGKAEKRADMGDYWWEQRACAYLDEFEKEKIVWNRIASEKVFSLVENGLYISDSMHFFTGKNLDFLICMLNSKLYSWILNLVVGTAAGGNAGNSSNVKDLHVINLPKVDQQPFTDLAEKIFQGKNKGKDTVAYEKQIDQLVYALYGLTEEEIRVVEGAK